MTSLIKTQLASYLERFVKNFERDQLKLSITKGRFELNDLEFDEGLLTDVAELPTWLKFGKITCNRLYVKIAWRKITSQPLHVHLDTVQVRLETCQPLRMPHPTSIFSMPDLPAMKYRLPHKIMDGTYLTINSLRFVFESDLMKADVQLLQLRTYPSTPEWEQADVIGKGRVKNSDLDETLVFRQVDFESMRMELASVGKNETDSRSVHLVTSSGNMRMIMKRRLSDAAVLMVKIDNLLDNIQLSLSETEMKSTVDFVRNIMALVKLSNQQTRILKAQRKYTLKQDFSKDLQAYLKKHIGEEYNEQMEKRPYFKDARVRYYMRHNIWETSHHMLLKAVDLTIVHDNKMPESFPEYKQYARYADASMSFHVANVRMDMHPFHLISDGYDSWMNRRHMVPGSEAWINALLSGYRRELGDGGSNASFEEDFQSLMSTTTIVGIGLLVIYPVITAKDVKSGNKPEELPFLSFQKEEFGLSDSVPGIEMALTNYYFAKDVPWPVPKGSIFSSVSPMRLSLDARTVDWMALMGMHVGLDLIRNLKELEKFMVGTSDPSTVKSLMRIETYFPRIFFPKSFNNRRERGSGIQIQAASIVITNTSIGQTKTVDEALPNMLKTNLYAHPTFFPNMTADWSLPDLIGHFRSFSQDPSRRPSMMCIEVNDLWTGAVSDEMGTSVPLPFLDAFSLRMWVVPGNSSISQKRSLVWGAAVVELDTPTVRVQLSECTLRLLAEVSGGIIALGDVGGEHMSLLPKLGCPPLGLCLLMQQENVEVSVILQSEYGQPMNAADALAISNLTISKETASLSSGSSTELYTGNSYESLPHTNGGHPSIPLGRRPSAPLAERFPATDASPVTTSLPELPNVPVPSLELSSNDTVKKVQLLSAQEIPWWRQGRKNNADNSDTEDTEGDASSVQGSTSDDTGYVEDDDGDDASVLAFQVNDVDDTASEAGSVAPFSWSTVGADRRRVPLASVPTSLLCLTLQSMQCYMMISHGHQLIKLRLGRIVTAQTRDMTLDQIASLPLQEPDLDVSRPEYLDTILVRFEQGLYSSHGDSPTVMTICRGLELQLEAESLRRLQAMMSGIGGGEGSSAKPLPLSDKSLEQADGKKKKMMTSVPLIDIRLTNIELRLKDAVDAAVNAVIPPDGQQQTTTSHSSKPKDVRDIRVKISGLAIQSNSDGLISVSSVRDEELDEDEDVATPSPRLVKRQLAILNERKAKLELRIGELQTRLNGPTAVA